MCPSIEFTRVFRVDTEPMDLSSEGDEGFSILTGIVLVMVRGGLKGKEIVPRTIFEWYGYRGSRQNLHRFHKQCY